VRIVVTGANSAVGQSLLRLGTQPQYAHTTLIPGVRSDRAAGQLPADVRDGAVRIDYGEPATLREAFTGASAVIHLAGTLIERPGSSYEAANVQTTEAVANAAGSCGVLKVVFISVIGADPASPNAYWRTKGKAEDLVRAAKCPHTILRVPLLLGPGTEGTKALQRHWSHSAVVLPGGGRNLQQPLHVDDLARGAMIAADPSVAVNRTLELVGPEPLPDYEIVTRGGRMLGRDIQVKSSPVVLLRLGLKLRGLFATSGFTAAVLDVITADTNVDPKPASAALGLQLTGLDDMIKQSLGQQP
jgi:uncharacterized protein YbjT (DUF2867 family)